MKAYMESRQAILNALRSLPKGCRPNSWIGTIKTKRTGSETNGGKTTTVVEKGDWVLLLTQNPPEFLPGSIPGLPPDAETKMRQAMAKNKALLAKSGMDFIAASTNVYIDRVTTWKGGGTECCSTDSGIEPDINMTYHEVGADRDKGNVNVIFTAGKLIISFSHPPIKGQKQEKQDVVKSNCPYDKSDIRDVEDTTLSLTLPNLDTSAASRIIGGVEFLEGSRTVKIGGYTFVYEWDLKRLIGR